MVSLDQGTLNKPPFILLQVPDAIKSQYQYPPPLLAPAGIRNGELVCNGIPEPPQKHLPTSQHLASEAEQQEVRGGFVMVKLKTQAFH